MSEQMVIYRLEDLSVTFFVKDLFKDFPMVNVVSSFPRQVLQLPTISVVKGRLTEEELEIGNRDRAVRYRRWFIDIFAINETQRDDFAYKILSSIDNGINVYDYNEGFPPDASPTKLNHLTVISDSYEPIDVIAEDNKTLYYRGQIILVTKNDLV